MSSPYPGEDGYDHFLWRLYASRDLAEALSTLLDSILYREGIDYGLILLQRGGELHGEIGAGWDVDVINSIAVPIDSAHVLARAFGQLGPTEVPAPAELGISNPERALAITLFGVPPQDVPFGLLLLGSGSGVPAIAEDYLERLRPIGSIIFRLREREELLHEASQLDQQNDLLTTTINALTDPVLITDVDNEIILENRRAESLFRTTDGDSSGRRRAVEINNLLFSSFLTRALLATGEGSVSRELNLVDPTEGGDLLFEVLSTSLPAARDLNQAHLSVLRDVTDLKSATTELEHQFKRVRQAEVKSRRERDRLNLILENVGDPILVTDEESNIILMNREAERLFDIPPGTALRSRRRQDVRANDTKFSSFISDFALSSDGTRVAQIALREPEGGEVFPAEVVSGKVTNERGEMTAIVSILHDLTKSVENERLASELGLLNENLEDRIRTSTLELEERNRQLEWQREELERAYRLKSQFLASMSHELRTPINALLGYTSLMRDQIYGELNRRQEEALSRMYTASQHLLELVNDILDLAKIEAGKMPVNIESVDVRLVIRELSQTIEPMVRRKELEYVVNLDPRLPVIRTDTTKVKQVVLNLLSNAVKFTHQGRVAVTARRALDGDGIFIEVSDTGIGIHESDIGNIFEDFRQVDQSSTREYGGTGLGLSITKKLLHLLGGTVQVDSTFGVGTTFRVWLPKESQGIVKDADLARMAREANEAITDRREGDVDGPPSGTVPD